MRVASSRTAAGPFGCWTRCERSSAYRLGPELPRRVRPRPISGKMCQFVPFCATPYLSGVPTVAQNVIPVCHGILWIVGGIGPATRFDARGLDLSAGECLSRGQSSTDVLSGSMASTKNRKALAQPSFPRRARPVETGRGPCVTPRTGARHSGYPSISVAENPPPLGSRLRGNDGRARVSEDGKPSPAWCTFETADAGRPRRQSQPSGESGPSGEVSGATGVLTRHPSCPDDCADLRWPGGERWAAGRHTRDRAEAVIRGGRRSGSIAAQGRLGLHSGQDPIGRGSAEAREQFLDQPDAARVVSDDKLRQQLEGSRQRFVRCCTSTFSSSGSGT